MRSAQDHQGFVQFGFESLQGWRLHSLSGLLNLHNLLLCLIISVVTFFLLYLVRIIFPIYACRLSLSCCAPQWRTWLYLLDSPLVLDSTGRLLLAPSQSCLFFQAKQAQLPQYLLEEHVLQCTDYFCGPPKLAWIYWYHSCTGGSRTGCSMCRQSDKNRVKKNNCFPWTTSYASVDTSQDAVSLHCCQETL